MEETLKIIEKALKAGRTTLSEYESKQILTCFYRMHLDSINMTLLASLGRNESFWVQARVIPRISLPPWGISDVNYFEKGHDEIISIISPEDLAREIRALL